MDSDAQNFIIFTVILVVIVAVLRIRGDRAKQRKREGRRKRHEAGRQRLDRARSLHQEGRSAEAALYLLGLLKLEYRMAADAMQDAKCLEELSEILADIGVDADASGAARLAETIAGRLSKNQRLQRMAEADAEQMRSVTAIAGSKLVGHAIAGASGEQAAEVGIEGELLRLSEMIAGIEEAVAQL